MNKEYDRNWSAYIDGELSASEAEAFESKLSAEELEHLNKEKAFEQSIGDSLSNAPSCPDHLFEDVVKKISAEGGRSGRAYKLLSVAALAACLGLVFLWPAKQLEANNSPMTVAELKSQAITGDHLDDINKFLREKNIELELTTVDDGHHHAKSIIGAGIEKVAGEEVVTLMFTCCGRPAKVYLLRNGSRAEELMVNDGKAAKGSIQALVKKGNYRLAVSSPHDSVSLLAYINHT